MARIGVDRPQKFAHRVGIEDGAMMLGLRRNQRATKQRRRIRLGAAGSRRVAEDTTREGSTASGRLELSLGLLSFQSGENIDRLKVGNRLIRDRS